MMWLFVKLTFYIAKLLSILLLSFHMSVSQSKPAAPHWDRSSKALSRRCRFITAELFHLKGDFVRLQQNK